MPYVGLVKVKPYSLQSNMSFLALVQTFPIVANKIAARLRATCPIIQFGAYRFTHPFPDRKPKVALWLY
jgi:hypothetical protein